MVAVDVGGTDMKAALVSGTPTAATVVTSRRRVTPRGEDGTGTAHAVVSAIVELVDELRGAVDHPVDAVGVVVPGVVDEAEGIGVFSANLGWRDFPFRLLLAERTGLPVSFGHDVRAGGLAEHRLGAARGLTDVVIMPIGTGIAAALMIGGRLHVHGGELGHVDVGHGEPCGCGQRGCVEAVASSAAIARRYSARTGQQVDRASVVADLVRAGDPDAVAVWHDAVDALAKGILIAATLLGPEAVVLGGGLALAGDLLIEPLRKRLAELIVFQRQPDLLLAALGDEAGCLGAALMAIDAVDAPASGGEGRT
ncbi:glucokinase [Kutzneria sp. 744]|nr:glucokinase [Kutzneria sp. 744]